MNGIPVKMPCCRRFMIETWPSSERTAPTSKQTRQARTPITQSSRTACSSSFLRKVTASEQPSHTVVRTSQAVSHARTMRETCFNALKIKNPQGLGKTLRIAPASSSSPAPQPTRERWSLAWAGLLAYGSPYSPCLPIRIRTVALTGFVPIHSGGTARELHPLPLTQESQCGGTLGDCVEICQVHYCPTLFRLHDSGSSHTYRITKSSQITITCQPQTRHKPC